MRIIGAAATATAVVAAGAALAARTAAQAQTDQPVVAQIIFEGDTTIPREDLLKAIRTKHGNKLVPAQLEKDARALKRLGNFAAVTHTTEPVADGVRVTFHLAANAEEVPPAPTEDNPPPGPGPGGDEPPPAEGAVTPEEPTTPEEPVAPPPIVPLARGTDAGPAKIGVVYWPEVVEKWKATADLRQKIAEVRNERLFWTNHEGPYRLRLRSLTRDEIDEAVRLRYQTRNPTARDEARRQELEEMARELDAEYARLLAIPDRSPEEKRRFQELSDLRKLRTQEIEQMDKERTEQWDLRQAALEELDTIAFQKIVELLPEIAQEQDLAYVFRARELLYGGKDITADLVDRLNERVPELTNEEPPA
ncbi:MAG: POTRA domain-containing protein [Armatimonadota bacterium]